MMSSSVKNRLRKDSDDDASLKEAQARLAAIRQRLDMHSKQARESNAHYNGTNIPPHSPESERNATSATHKPRSRSHAFATANDESSQQSHRRFSRNRSPDASRQNGDHSDVSKLHARREAFFKGDQMPVGSGLKGSGIPLADGVSSGSGRSNYDSTSISSVTSDGSDVTVNGFAEARQAAEKKFQEKHMRDMAMDPASRTRQSAVIRNMDSAASIRTTKDGPYVGFANLPNQVYRKAVKRGFDFTLMVVGASGLGKSTLMNSLFLTDVYDQEHPGPSLRIKKTLQVETNKVQLREGTVELRLTIVDTPGFGDAVDNSECWKPVVDFIDSRYEEYLNAESRVVRTRPDDRRVHCCLYFIPPTGHGLRALDIEFMKQLHEKVNIVPLIAKADTMTPEECREFKRQIMNEIKKNGIQIYEFPELPEDEDDESEKKRSQRPSPRDRVPFAVVGSNCTVPSTDGRRIRGRQYPWGVVEVDNLEHNDFVALREMLIRTHMQDLQDVTHNVHYENYRFSKLAPQTPGGDLRQSGTDQSPLAQMEEEKREYEQHLKKMEAEMEQVLEMKVKDKLQKLHDSEADLERREEQMKEALTRQRKEVQEKRAQFMKDREEFDAQEREREKDTKKKKHLF